MDEQIQAARDLVEKVHGDQVDKAGEPYLNHVYRVASLASHRYGNDNPYFPPSSKRLEYIVGLLHDVVEDGDVTLEDIRGKFGNFIANAVNAITHIRNEPYGTYIERVKENRLATSVKLADLRDNSDFDRVVILARVDPEAFKRVVEVLVPRYFRAYHFLTKEDK